MKRIFLALILSFVSVDAHAIVRYMVQNMSCAEVKDALSRDGAAILYRKSKSGVALYDRFVKDGSMCAVTDTTAYESIAVADTDSCRVSKCVDKSRFGD